MSRVKAVFNLTREEMLASRAVPAYTRKQRRRGLLDRDSLPGGEALLIPRCRQVHTFGMRFAIDVLFLDSKGEVVKACAWLEPGRLSPLVLRSRLCVELPAGTLARSGTLEGDRISVADSPCDPGGARHGREGFLPGKNRRPSTRPGSRDLPATRF